MFSADHPLTEKAPLLPIVCSLIAGIVIGHGLSVSGCLPSLGTSTLLLPLLIGFVALVSLTILARRYPLLQSLLIYCSMMALGVLLCLRATEQLSRTADSVERAYEVIVASEPAEKAKTMAVDVMLCKSGEKVTCYIWKDEDSRQLRPGDGLLLKTKIEPGFQVYSLRCYVSRWKWDYAALSLRSLSLTDRTRIRFLIWRHRLLEKYRLLGAADDAFAVLAAMTLGDKSALTKELKDTYSVSGASHVLALSGLHLSIIYLLLSGITFSRVRRRVWSQALIVLSIWAFALLVGLPVSVVRSALMISIFALFSLSERPHLSVNLLCLAALIILLSSPLSLFDVGFQLSFMTVFSILVFTPLFTPVTSSRLLRPLYSCLAVSVAAQIGSAPLVAFYFGRFSTYFLLTNLVVIPAAYLLLFGTLLMLLLPPLAPVVVWLTHQLNSILTAITKLPMASLEGLRPSVVQVLLCYVFVATLYAIYWLLKGRRRF